MHTFISGRGYYFNSHNLGEHLQVVGVVLERRHSSAASFIIGGKVHDLPVTVLCGRETVRIVDAESGAVYMASASTSVDVAEAARIMKAFKGRAA